MIVDHTATARRAFDLSGLQPTPPLRNVEDALEYISLLLALLPPSEKAGYVSGPLGGENVAVMRDGSGRLVRVSRVMYPDGQIYKVMNDAPNGGPQWVAEDVRPELYIPFPGTSLPDAGTPPEPEGDVAAQLRLALLWIDHLKTRTELLQDAFGEVSKQIGALNQQLADLTNKPEPTYSVRIWGYRVPVTKE